MSGHRSTISNGVRKNTSTKGLNMLDETTTVQKLAAEAIGTAFLVFIGVGSVPATLIVNGNAPFTMADLGMISLAFGTIVIATVYALGHVGGNHINPAVTVGLAVSGKFPWSQVPAYIAAQVVGAIVGAAAIIGVLGHKASDVGLGVASYSGISWVQAFTAEFVGTFILVFTIFGVIYRKAAAGFAGVAIGLVVFAAIIPVAPATGASINPARTFGPMLVQQLAGGDVKWGQLPVYLAAELLAGALAALAYGFIAHTPADKASTAGIDLAAPEEVPLTSSATA
jgi:glycerol uptake facilitator protein